jgi:hypothetical protein
MTDYMISQEVKNLVQPGRALHVYKNLKSKFATKKIHVRAIVDDDYVVYRFWTISHGWVYKVQDLYYFQLLYENGDLE